MKTMEYATKYIQVSKYRIIQLDLCIHLDHPDLKENQKSWFTKDHLTELLKLLKDVIWDHIESSSDEKKAKGKTAERKKCPSRTLKGSSIHINYRFKPKPTRQSCIVPDSYKSGGKYKGCRMEKDKLEVIVTPCLPEENEEPLPSSSHYFRPGDKGEDDSGEENRKDNQKQLKKITSNISKKRRGQSKKKAKANKEDMQEFLEESTSRRRSNRKKRKTVGKKYPLRSNRCKVKDDCEGQDQSESEDEEADVSMRSRRRSPATKNQETGRAGKKSKSVGRKSDEKSETSRNEIKAPLKKRKFRVEDFVLEKKEEHSKFNDGDSVQDGIDHDDVRFEESDGSETRVGNVGLSGGGYEPFAQGTWTDKENGISEHGELTETETSHDRDSGIHISPGCRKKSSFFGNGKGDFTEGLPEGIIFDCKTGKAVHVHRQTKGDDLKERNKTSIVSALPQKCASVKVVSLGKGVEITPELSGVSLGYINSDKLDDFAKGGKPLEKTMQGQVQKFCRNLKTKKDLLEQKKTAMEQAAYIELDEHFWEEKFSGNIGSPGLGDTAVQKGKSEAEDESDLSDELPNMEAINSQSSNSSKEMITNAPSSPLFEVPDDLPELSSYDTEGGPEKDENLNHEETMPTLTPAVRKTNDISPKKGPSILELSPGKTCYVGIGRRRRLAAVCETLKLDEQFCGNKTESVNASPEKTDNRPRSRERIGLFDSLSPARTVRVQNQEDSSDEDSVESVSVSEIPMPRDVPSHLSSCQKDSEDMEKTHVLICNQQNEACVSEPLTFCKEGPRSPCLSDRRSSEAQSINSFCSSNDEVEAEPKNRRKNRYQGSYVEYDSETESQQNKKGTKRKREVGSDVSSLASIQKSIRDEDANSSCSSKVSSGGHGEEVTKKCRSWVDQESVNYEENDDERSLSRTSSRLEIDLDYPCNMDENVEDDDMQLRLSSSDEADRSDHVETMSRANSENFESLSRKSDVVTNDEDGKSTSSSSHGDWLTLNPAEHIPLHPHMKVSNPISVEIKNTFPEEPKEAKSNVLLRIACKKVKKSTPSKGNLGSTKKKKPAKPKEKKQRAKKVTKSCAASSSFLKTRPLQNVCNLKPNLEPDDEGLPDLLYPCAARPDDLPHVMNNESFGENMAKKRPLKRTRKKSKETDASPKSTSAAGKLGGAKLKRKKQKQSTANEKPGLTQDKLETSFAKGTSKKSEGISKKRKTVSQKYKEDAAHLMSSTDDETEGTFVSIPQKSDNRKSRRGGGKLSSRSVSDAETEINFSVSKESRSKKDNTEDSTQHTGVGRTRKRHVLPSFGDDEEMKDESSLSASYLHLNGRKSSNKETESVHENDVIPPWSPQTRSRNLSSDSSTELPSVSFVEKIRKRLSVAPQKEEDMDICVIVEELSTPVVIKVEGEVAKQHEKEIESVSDVSELSDEHLTYLVNKNEKYLREIFQGKRHCERHEDYKKGGKDRQNLMYQIHSLRYKESQLDVVMNNLVEIFCSRHQKYLDYVFKVMFPEMLLKIYMEVHHCDFDQAEAALQDVEVEDII